MNTKDEEQEKGGGGGGAWKYDGNKGESSRDGRWDSCELSLFRGRAGSWGPFRPYSSSLGYYVPNGLRGLPTFRDRLAVHLPAEIEYFQPRSPHLRREEGKRRGSRSSVAPRRLPRFALCRRVAGSRLQVGAAWWLLLVVRVENNFFLYLNLFLLTSAASRQASIDLGMSSETSSEIRLPFLHCYL